MDKAIHALVRAALDQVMAPQKADEKLAERAACLMHEKIKAMPLLLRSSVYAATWIFHAAALFFGYRKLLAFAGDGCRPWQQFIRFYKKLSAYIYYSLLTQNDHA